MEITFGPTWRSTHVCPKCGLETLDLVAAEARLTADGSRAGGMIIFCPSTYCSFQVPLTRGGDG